MNSADRDRLYPGRVTPPPDEWRSFAWDGGLFQAAARPYTASVEGTILSAAPILMTTLRGGAERHEMANADGRRYDGPDRPGAVSFLPAGCARSLRLRGVAWHWASLTLAPGAAASVPSFCCVEDPVLHGLLAELDRLHRRDGALDGTYCDTVSAMLGAYLARRFGAAGAPPERPLRLTARQMRRIAEHVEEHLVGPIRFGALAALAGLSEGYFHRAFRATTGETPLAYVTRRRVARAVDLLRAGDLPIAAIALEVGFASPTAFARSFRSIVGAAPSAYRRRLDLP